MPAHAKRLGPDRPPKNEIGGAANRIPTEIAIQISKYLSVKDLAHGAVAWRALASASHDTASFIRTECARFNLRILGAWTARTDLLPGMRDRIAQYNHAWSTLQYTSGRSFVIPQTAYDTPWAGSFGWRAGTLFMGESGGWTYNTHSWVEQGPQQNQLFRARVSLYEIPSLRTGEMSLRNVQIDVPLFSGYVKAVAVDPVARRVGVLEYNDQGGGRGYSSVPILHVFNLNNGKLFQCAKLRVYGFPLGSEVYHMEIHGHMVCVVVNYDEFGVGTRSDVIVQNWTGAGGQVFIGHSNTYCLGFQFLTEDLYIMTEKAKTHPSDQILSSCITIGHIGKRLKMDLPLDDPLNTIGITVTNITVIRNVAPHGPVPGPFYMDPASRLFGFKFNYKMFDGTWDSHACLFGRSTVEAWLGLTPALGTEPPHWLFMGTGNVDRAEVLRQSMEVYDPTNREGVALIGRRLFWSGIWPSGWIFQLADYNPGAGAVIGKKMQTLCDSGQLWQSFTGLFCEDPYSVAHTFTSRVYGPRRIIPFQDGLLIKTDGNNFMALVM